MLRVVSPSQSIRLSTAPLLWGGLALLLGWLIATQPVVVTAGVLGLGLALLLALSTPLTALILLLVIAPLRTLFATEAGVPLPLDVGQLALIGFIGCWLLYRLARQQTLLRLTPSAVYLPVLVFFAAATLSLSSAYSTGAWLNEWLKWVQILLLITIVLTLGRWEWLVFGLVLAGVANAVIGIYQFFGGSGALSLLINERFFRAFGTFGQPNPFGGFMGLLAPIAIMTTYGYLMRAWGSWQLRRAVAPVTLLQIGFYATAAGLLILGVLLSWSRGAWLGFAASGVALAFALPRKLWRSLALLTTLIAIVGVLWFTGRLPTAIVERVNSAVTEMVASPDVRGVTVTNTNYAIVERLAHWQAAFNMARAHPWLGVGLGNYEAAYPQFRLLAWPLPLGHAHNMYLNMLGETGLVGLMSYVALWLSIAWLTWRTRRHPDELARSVAVGLLGTWVYLSVHSLTDNLYVNNMFLHIGVMLGVLAVLYQSVVCRNHLR